MSRNINKVSIFAVGAAIGSVIALMFAPFSGKKMRKLTSDKAKVGYGKAKDKYSSFEKSTLKPNILKARLKGKKAWENSKGQAGKGKDAVVKKAEEVGGSFRSRLSKKEEA